MNVSPLLDRTYHDGNEELLRLQLSERAARLCGRAWFRCFILPYMSEQHLPHVRAILHDNIVNTPQQQWVLWSTARSWREALLDASIRRADRMALTALSPYIYCPFDTLRRVMSTASELFSMSTHQHDVLTDADTPLSVCYWVPLREHVPLLDMFRPWCLWNPRWRTESVVELAKIIDEQQATDRLSILADALMDAECDAEVILQRLRNVPENHWHRGSWLIDTILGKYELCDTLQRNRQALAALADYDFEYINMEPDRIQIALRDLPRDGDPEVAPEGENEVEPVAISIPFDTLPSSPYIRGGAQESGPRHRRRTTSHDEAAASDHASITVCPATAREVATVMFQALRGASAADRDRELRQLHNSAPTVWQLVTGMLAEERRIIREQAAVNRPADRVRPTAFLRGHMHFPVQSTAAAVIPDAEAREALADIVRPVFVRDESHAVPGTAWAHVEGSWEVDAKTQPETRLIAFLSGERNLNPVGEEIVLSETHEMPEYTMDGISLRDLYERNRNGDVFPALTQPEQVSPTGLYTEHVNRDGQLFGLHAQLDEAVSGGITRATLQDALALMPSVGIPKSQLNWEVWQQAVTAAIRNADPTKLIITVDSIDTPKTEE